MVVSISIKVWYKDDYYESYEFNLINCDTNNASKVIKKLGFNVSNDSTYDSLITFEKQLSNGFTLSGTVEDNIEYDSLTLIIANSREICNFILESILKGIIEKVSKY